MIRLFGMLVIAMALDGSAAVSQELSGSASWADSARREIEVARAKDDLSRLAQVRLMLERALAAYPDDAMLLHYLGYAGYREAEARLAGGGTQGVAPLVQGTLKALERAARIEPLAETHALIANVLGQRLRLEPARAAVLGRQASGQMDRAAELGPENPRVWPTKGRRSIFIPAEFGGGLGRAETCLKRAIELFAADRPEPPRPAWGEAEAHLWLGQVYERRGKHDQARQEYTRVLEIEPENAWAGRVLMPRTEKTR